MLRSMTTFARVDIPEEGWISTMELRSVNSRYCDVNSRVPKVLTPLEDRMKKLVQRRLKRGRIDLYVQMDSRAAERPVFEPDLELGRSYLVAVRQLADTLGLEGAIDISTILASVRDVIVVKEREQDLEESWGKIEKAVEKMLDRAEAMSRQEGAVLEQDLVARLHRIEELVERISARSAEHVLEARQALRERIQAILNDVAMDEARMALEIALLADRLDITEEIVRARSHAGQFKSLLSEDGAVGRRLDFLLQELFREVNTMAAKSSDAEISHVVVEIKGELEKMREQVQNVV
jgi:uncharacterized protein (TIGR00255 family)